MRNFDLHFSPSFSTKVAQNNLEGIAFQSTYMDIMQKEDYSGDSCAFLFSYSDLIFLNGHHFGIFL